MILMRTSVFFFIIIHSFYNEMAEETVNCFNNSNGIFCSKPYWDMAHSIEICCKHWRGIGFSYSLKQLEFEKTPPIYGCELCENYQFAGQWGEWSVCNVDCGSGTRKRKRECSSKSNRTIFSKCIGKETEKEVCDLQPCDDSDKSDNSETSSLEIISDQLQEVNLTLRVKSTRVLIIACVGTALGVVIIIMIVIFVVKIKIPCSKRKVPPIPAERNQYSMDPTTADFSIDSEGYLNPIRHSSQRNSNPEEHLYETISYYTFMGDHSPSPTKESEIHNYSNINETKENDSDYLKMDQRSTRFSKLKKSVTDDHFNIQNQNDSEYLSMK